jgi:hypothetical protein
MATPVDVIDPKATNHAGINLTDVSYVALTSGTDAELAWDGTAAIVVKNTNASSRQLTFTVPVPSGTALADIGSTPTSKVYTLAGNKEYYFRNADSFRNPTTGKTTFQVDGTDCFAIGIAF